MLKNWIQPEQKKDSLSPKDNNANIIKPTFYLYIIKTKF